MSHSCENNLQIGASGVEVEVQGLSANGDFADILDVLGVRLGWDGAVLALDKVSEKDVDDALWLGGSQAVLGVGLEQSKRTIALVVAVVDGGDAKGRRDAGLGGRGGGNTRSGGGEQSKLAGGDHFDGGLA